MGIGHEAEEKLVEVVKEAKKKNPGYIKWIIGVIVAIVMAAIGFFGGIFGLTEKQQSDIKQAIIGSSVYKEMTAEPEVKTADSKEEKKAEVAPKTEEKK